MERKFKIRFMNKNSKKRHKAHFELKRQGDKSLVKWMGYPKLFNSWIDTQAMVKLTTEKSL